MSSTAYAVIRTGGKQYRVEPEDVIDIELLDAAPGDEIVFSEVLFLQDGTSAKVGTPTIAGSKVIGQLLEQTRGPKITSLKYKKRKSQKTKWGHRQGLSRVLITDIGFGTTTKAASKPKAAKKEVAKKEAVKKEASKPAAAKKAKKVKDE